MKKSTMPFRMLVMFLWLGIATGTSPQAANIQKQPAPKTAPDRKMAEEFDNLNARASAIQQRLESSNSQIATQAQAEWDNLIRDLDSWARKYNARTENRTETHPGVRPKDGVTYAYKCHCVKRSESTEPSPTGRPGQLLKKVCVLTKCYYDRRTETEVCDYRCYFRFISILD